MKKKCAWCEKEINIINDETNAVTHGICNDCKIDLVYKDLSLRELIESFKEPILILIDQAIVSTGNKAALKMLGKDFVDIEGKLGGDVMECVYSELPGGCGHTEHCTGCTIRNTVMDTLSTGKHQKNRTAYQYIQTPEGPQKMKFIISTEKFFDVVLLKIEEATPAI
ncbi:MAG: hypothetical protein KAI43_03020 [Candidatus Aureabacteria bacterium]|nr:hypothetical protein [Candidatus Auribacterota bacterium]